MDDVNASKVATMRPTTRSTPGTCPLVNLDDPRCDSRLSLSHLDQAFAVCFGAYHTCPMYKSITRERAADAELTRVCAAQVHTLDVRAAVEVERVDVVAVG